MKLLPPKFLTPAIAQVAVKNAFEILFNGVGIADLVSRNIGHVIVIVPAMKDERAEDYPSYPDYPIHPYILYEESFHKSVWPYEFDNIARCKGLQLWHERNDDRTDCIPHLLFPGDTPFWGGVYRHGIVVAFSGTQPYFDKMVSGMVADLCVGLAYHAWMTSDDKNAIDDREAAFLR